MLQVGKIPEQQITPTTPSKNEQNIKNTLAGINPNKYLFILLFYKAASVQSPVLEKVGGTPEGKIVILIR